MTQDADILAQAVTNAEEKLETLSIQASSGTTSMPSSNGEPCSAPIYKVLHITEIIEHVLKYLLEKDLLVNAQRTCKVSEPVAGQTAAR